MILKLRDKFDIRYPKKRMRVEDLPIDHYITVPNLINSQKKQVGGVFQIPADSSSVKEMTIIDRLTQFMVNFTGKLPTHLLGNTG